MYPNWHRRRRGGHPYISARWTASPNNSYRPPDLSHFYTPEGDLTHPGWMSESEVTNAMIKLRLAGEAKHHPVKAKLKHLHNNECMFILYNSHWTVLLCKHQKLMFFDPAGNPARMYLEGPLPHVHDLNLQCQPQDSVLCANYCLFAADCIINKMPTSNKHNVAADARTFLGNFLYFSPARLGPNCMMMTLYTFHNELGEEFDAVRGRYPKFQNYKQWFLR
ncbi:TPA_asm: LO8 [Tilapia adomavirus 2]|uniref:LO8 n=1 Tax=Tilapia adomavirus 2 TaxID=2597804 RepID=A0A5H3CX86_9VIRU|nr:TPA_asm: LO8 [Tilapia adomavirus 2]